MAGGYSGRKCVGRSKSRSNRVRSRPSCFLISSIWCLGNTMPPSGWLGCGKGRKPLGHSPFSRISSGVMAARSCHDFTPAGSFARTPSWTGLPRDMVTPLGRPVAQVVPLLQQFHLPLHDFGLGGRHPGHHLVEILLHHHRGVAVGRLLVPTDRLAARKRHQAPERRGPPERSCHTNCTCESSFHPPVVRYEHRG